MAKNDILTQDYLRQILDYNPEDGIFIWKWREDSTFASNKKNSGKIAGHLSAQGHVQIMIQKKRFYAHRLAWLYVYGEFPPEDIDHINADRQDNRILNLRKASRSENNYNRKTQKNNKTGIKGVYKFRNKYRVQIVVNKKAIHIGMFDTIEQAKAAHEEAIKKYHREFARAG